MQIITKAALIHGLDKIEVFSILVNLDNYKIVRKKLEQQHDLIIKILKELKNQGEIKGLAKPRSKKFQKELNKLVQTKKMLKNSIINVCEMFYK